MPFKDKEEFQKFVSDRQKMNRAFQKTFNRLLKIYSAESVIDALAGFHYAVAARPTAEHGRGGRATEFGTTRLLDLWLFVQIGVRINRSPIAAYCKKAKFSWFALGLPSGIQESTVSGPTLHRRYYQAVNFLKNEARVQGLPPEALNDILNASKSDLSQTALSLRKEMERQLA